MIAFLFNNWELCLGVILAIITPFSGWLYGQKKYRQGKEEAYNTNLEHQVKTTEIVNETHRENKELSVSELDDKFKRL
jgi:hypothetical protein